MTGGVERVMLGLVGELSLQALQSVEGLAQAVALEGNDPPRSGRPHPFCPRPARRR